MKIRPAALAAHLIEVGDVLVDIPWIGMAFRFDRATAIGRVIGVGERDGCPVWDVETPDGRGIEVSADGSPYVGTYVHVPTA